MAGPLLVHEIPLDCRAIFLTDGQDAGRLTLLGGALHLNCLGSAYHRDLIDPPANGR